MADQIDMTLSEASTILGVSSSSSREDVQKAYRTLAKKYHPDAWIGKPDADRERAAKIYGKLNNARSVLLNPSRAKPEPGAQQQYDPFADGTVNVNSGSTSSSSYGGSGYGSDGSSSGGYSSYGSGGSYGSQGVDGTTTSQGRAPRRRHYGEDSVFGGDSGQGSGSPAPNPWATQGNNVRRTHRTPGQVDDNVAGFGVHGQDVTGRGGSNIQKPKTSGQRAEEKYNHAKSFSNQFGSLREPYEDALDKQYRRYANRRYRQKGDVLRRSLSMVVTVAMLVAVLFGVSADVVSPAVNGNVAIDGATTGFTVARDTTPYLIGIIACVVKFIVWDMIAAFYVKRALHSKSAALDGIPTVIGAVVLTAVVVPPLWGTSTAIYSLAIGIGGVVLGGIACAISAAKHADGKDWERL